MSIFINWTSDLELTDRNVLSQICLTEDCFCYYRWTHAWTNQYYISQAKVCAKSNLITGKFKSPGERAGLYYRGQHSDERKHVKTLQTGNKSKPLEASS